LLLLIEIRQRMSRRRKFIPSFLWLYCCISEQDFYKIFAHVLRTARAHLAQIDARLRAISSSVHGSPIDAGSLESPLQVVNNQPGDPRFAAAADCIAGNLGGQPLDQRQGTMRHKPSRFMAAGRRSAAN
jgi:hypothetical protein